MKSFENEITIHCGLEEVFDLATDLARVPMWNYYVHSVTPTSEHPGTKGATYHQIRRTDEQELRIVDVKPHELFIVETIPPSKPAFRREMVFSGDEEVTHIIDRWQLDVGVPWLLAPIAANRAKSGVKQNLNKLKNLLETGQVTLQDGRLFTL